MAVPPTPDSQPVRRFACTTAELKAMADWLKQCGILRLANVLSDVSGVTGQAISEAILACERHAHKLAAFRDFREWSLLSSRVTHSNEHRRAKALRYYAVRYTMLSPPRTRSHALVLARFAPFFLFCSFW